MKILSILLTMALVACSHSQSYDEDLQEWQGQSVDVLYQQWGQPQSTQNLDNGQLLITYSEQDVENISPSTSFEQQISGNAPSFADNNFFDQQETYFCTTTFTIEDGIVTDYEFEGTSCN